MNAEVHSKRKELDAPGYGLLQTSLEVGIKPKLKARLAMRLRANLF